MLRDGMIVKRTKNGNLHGTCVFDQLKCPNNMEHFSSTQTSSNLFWDNSDYAITITGSSQFTSGHLVTIQCYNRTEKSDS